MVFLSLVLRQRHSGLPFNTRIYATKMLIKWKDILDNEPIFCLIQITCQIYDRNPPGKSGGCRDHKENQDFQTKCLKLTKINAGPLERNVQLALRNDNL